MDHPQPKETKSGQSTGEGSYSSFSSWFINRPVATALLTLAIVLLGVFAFPRLPVAPLPQADFPTISISAGLPGASPDTMASAIATPLETAFTAIPGITEMTSSNSIGSTNITLQFELNKDIDSAAQEVQAAINSVSGRLPDDMPNLPTWRKLNPADSPVLILTINDPYMDLTQLSDMADVNLARQINQLPGVGEVRIFGAQKPAIRIGAQPDRLASYGLTMQDLRTALQEASVNRAKGTVPGRNTLSTFATNDQIFSAEDYQNVIIAYRDQTPVYMRDVATVTLGPENLYSAAFPNGQRGLGIAITRQPGENVVKIADTVRASLPNLTKALPATTKVEVLNDRTRTIRASLHEVELTLVITLILVVLVMGLFLRQVSATLIVAAVLGSSLVATFAAMYVLGFSLNNLTLVSLVIAVGFVVDDAIVVVENIHRHMELGEDSRTAALKGAGEIGFTVLSITFSLIAAFIPLLFMDGIVGRLFFEFAVTITVSLLISVVMSLTLAPMLAARFMKAPKHRDTGKDFSTRLQNLYDRSLQVVLRHQGLTLITFFITVAIAVAGYMWIPKGFFPLQDTAFVQGSTQAADDISYEDMLVKQKLLQDIIAKDPAVSGFNNIIGGGGGGGWSNGRFFIVLKDRGDRDVSSEEFIDRIRPQAAKIPGITLSLRSAQDINLSAGGGSAQYVYVLKGQDYNELAQWSERMTDAMSNSPGFRDVRHNLQLGARMQNLTIDRVAAARYGFNVDDIDQALYDAYAQRQVNEFQTQVNQYKIILGIDDELAKRVDSMDYFYLRSPLTQEMVPLSAVTTREAPTSGPVSINRYGQFPAVTISFNLPKGVALGDAIADIERLRGEINMPDTITGEPQGAALIFQDSLKSQPLLILAAVLAVYIILGVLYESFSTPLTILSTLPSAGIGAVLFLWLFQLDFSIMALIGVILLIGIVKKNGILMVDFALDAQRNGGLSAADAIYKAAITRFRPIIMTTIAAMLAAIPLMIGHGTGAELRQPLGVAVVGGLLVSQVLTLFSTPVIYLALDRLFHGRKKPAPVTHPAE
ncbi:efflux RND transporter permease subunit [Asticcacaulis endophyticus]|uniref:Resistance-nodulation-cell division (RND) efflux transporter n=1 Tax=Asticcacaulis endophyticus TaxID=1395890 RepID=A0A918Q070_9CAUL|nr:efflux RND transporter permease subunit [Asticcacaulis endophyticus]GGZ26897.1 resistance-nodulation-cell division (RND) efflux transporter [Asticcacaulis endophyticus]